MPRTISVSCPNVIHCGHVNVFPEDELVGEVPLVAEDGGRIPPPPCGYPISCADAEISD
jgi:hypothetical protein